MALCEKLISDCIAISCENPVYAGIQSTGWIFNKKDIDEGTVTYATIGTGECVKKDPNRVTGITLGTGIKGYQIQQLGKTPFSGTQTEMVEGTNMNTFTNTVSVLVPDNSSTASHNIIDNLANGKFVVILANEYSGSDEASTYQIFGLNKGLSASAITNEKYSEDTMGGWAVTLTEENAPVSGVFFWDTDKATTLGDINAIVDTCTVGTQCE